MAMMTKNIQSFGSMISELAIIAGLAIALLRSDELPLPPYIFEIYPIVFVTIVFVFFGSGYILLLHDKTQLKKLHEKLSKVKKWHVALPTLLFGTIHIAVMIGLLVFHPSFEQANTQGGFVSMFSFWMLVVVTIVATTLPAIVLESMEYAKDHMKWVEKIHSKFPTPYAICYAIMSILMPVFAWGTLAWVIKRTNIVTKKLSNGARSFLSTSLETSFGFLIAIVIAFETFFVRMTEGSTSIAELLWPTLLVFFLLYVPFKWFVSITDRSHNKKHDVARGFVMIILQIIVVLLLA